jgi:hypothetical protein
MSLEHRQMSRHWGVKGVALWVNGAAVCFLRRALRFEVGAQGASGTVGKLACSE